MRGSLTAARLLTLLFFLLLISICSYWTLQVVSPRPAIAPSASLGDTTVAPNLAAATALFGSASAPTAGAPAASDNIQVSGIAEAGASGVVILSVDGKPGAAYGVNDRVTEGTIVKSVALDKVVLDQRGRLIELKTPVRASLDILSSGLGKPRAAIDSSTAAPVSTRPAPPAPLPPSPRAPPPSLQPPLPPQQQQIQQQQQVQQQLKIQQQQQQQQQQEQQPSQQYQSRGVAMPGVMPGNALPAEGSQAIQGSGQAGASAGVPAPSAVSGQQQIRPDPSLVRGQQQLLREQPDAAGQQAVQ